MFTIKSLITNLLERTSIGPSALHLRASFALANASLYILK